MPKTTRIKKTATKALAEQGVTKVKRTKLASGVATMHILSPSLPEPEELAKYEKIIPGGAERILELAEQQFEQESALAAHQLETSARTTRIKQFITFVLALAGIALGSALLLQGSELAGLIVIAIDAATLIGSKLYQN